MAYRGGTVTTCANCNRSIGNLEITQQHEGHVVCNECKALLSVPKAQAAKQKDVWERHIMSAGFEKTDMPAAPKVGCTMFWRDWSSEFSM